MNAQETTPSKASHIAIVIGSGALFGLLAVLLLLYMYNPTGQYRVSQALLSPDTLKELSYSGRNLRTGGSSRFVLDSIRLTYLDESSGQWKQVEVEPLVYRALYHRMKNDLSLLSVPEEVEEIFQAASVATLTIEVKTESPAKWQAVHEPFQRLQFASDGTHYRIELHEDEPGTNWAYFSHPGLLALLKDLIR